MNHLIVILGFAAFILILKFRSPIKDFVGDIGFAEKYLGPGGTHTFIIIFAFLCFILPLMWALGTIQAIFYSTFGRFFGV
jgi:hypothetical protein